MERLDRETRLHYLYMCLHRKIKVGRAAEVAAAADRPPYRD